MNSNTIMFYENKIKKIKKRRRIMVVITAIIVISSIALVTMFIESVEEVMIDRYEKNHNLVEEYYKNVKTHEKSGFTKEVIDELYDTNNQIINNGKSLLETLLGYCTLLASIIAVACVNYCFQLSNRIDDYEEKLAIEESVEK